MYSLLLLIQLSVVGSYCSPRKIAVVYYLICEPIDRSFVYEPFNIDMN